MSDKSLISLQSVASENRYSMKIIRAFWEVVCQAAFNVMMHLENHCCLSLYIHRSIASKHHDPEGMVENGSELTAADMLHYRRHNSIAVNFTFCLSFFFRGKG